VYTDHGTITAGLETYGSRRRARWFEQHDSGGYPSLPDTCPNPGCGTTDRPFSYYGADYLYIAACGPEPLELLNELWRTLRSSFPDLATEADQATHRYRPMPAPTRR
jgi:hypothetical protein